VPGSGGIPLPVHTCGRWSPARQALVSSAHDWVPTECGVQAAFGPCDCAVLAVQPWALQRDRASRLKEERGKLRNAARGRRMFMSLVGTIAGAGSGAEGCLQR